MVKFPRGKIAKTKTKTKNPVIKWCLRMINILITKPSFVSIPRCHGIFSMIIRIDWSFDVLVNMWHTNRLEKRLSDSFS